MVGFGVLDQAFIEAINAADAQALTELAIHSSAEPLEQLRERLRRAGQDNKSVPFLAFKRN